jgi:hypothetical protein
MRSPTRTVAQNSAGGTIFRQNKIDLPDPLTDHALHNVLNERPIRQRVKIAAGRTGPTRKPLAGRDYNRSQVVCLDMNQAATSAVDRGFRRAVILASLAMRSTSAASSKRGWRHPGDAWRTASNTDGTTS